MISNYNFRKYLDKYYLTNTGSDPITYVLDRLDYVTRTGDEVFVNVSNGVVSVTEVQIVLPKDSHYRLTLTRGQENHVLSIRHFLQLQKDLIRNTVKVLCTSNDTDCVDCLDCDEANSVKQALFNDILGYKFLAKPYAPDEVIGNALFDRFLQEALDQNKKYLSTKIYNDLNKQLLTGQVEATSDTLGIFAAIYLSAFYYYEKMVAINDTEKAFVDTKFNWAITSICIGKYIPFQNMEQIFLQVADLCPDLGEYVTRDEVDGRFLLNEASITINSQQIALKVSQTEFNNLGMIVNQHASAITLNAQQIQLRVTYAEFNALGDRVSLAETSITQTAYQIALKANSTTVNALTGRVEANEASITLTSQQIALKVNKDEFDTLGNRLTSAESSIIQNANQIAQKVSITQFNELGGRISANESSIVQLGNSIALKVSQVEFGQLNQKVLENTASIVVLADSITSTVSHTEFDALGARVGINESQIVQNANQIALKVSTSEFNALGVRVTTAESAITQTANEISLKVSQDQFNNLALRVGTAEASIDINESAIISKVSQTDFNAAAVRIGEAESRITQLANSIELGVSQEEFNALGQRVSNAEASIVVNAQAITSKVSTTDYNGNTLVSMINQTAANITISAAKINLVGQITIDALKKGDDANALLTVNGMIKADKINVNDLVATNIEAVTGTIGGFTIGSDRLVARTGGTAVGDTYNIVALQSANAVGGAGLVIENRTVTGQGTSTLNYTTARFLTGSTPYLASVDVGNLYAISILIPTPIQVKNGANGLIYSGFTGYELVSSSGPQTRKYINGVYVGQGPNSSW